MDKNTVEHGQIVQGHVVTIISSNAGQSLDIIKTTTKCEKKCCNEI